MLQKDIQTYCLMEKDTLVLEFDLEYKDGKYEITRAEPYNRARWPKGLFYSEDSKMLAPKFSVWLKARKNNLHFHFKDGEEYGEYGHIFLNRAMSLNDTYWVVADNDPTKWEQVSPYRNTLDKELAKAAFSDPEYQLKARPCISAEPTTLGTSRKCWVNGTDGIFLRKAADSSIIQQDGRSTAVMEFYAAQVAAAMGIPHVQYSLAKFVHPNGEEEIVCECPLFTSEEIGFVSAQHYVNEAHITSTGKEFGEWTYAKLRSPGFHRALSELFGLDFYSDMMLFDSIILNKDRHSGNFGYLIENSTGIYKNPAPLFDNGDSILVHARDLTNISAICNAQTWSTRGKFMAFDTMAFSFVQKRHVPILKQLRDFKFRQPEDKSLGVGGEVMAQMSQIIQQRAERALQLYSLKKKSKGKQEIEFV